MSTKPHHVRLPDELTHLIDAKAREDWTDRATALHQFSYAGAEGYVLRLVSDGRLSAGRAAEILGVSPYVMQTIARDAGVNVSAAPEEYQRGATTAMPARGRPQRLRRGLDERTVSRGGAEDAVSVSVFGTGCRGGRLHCLVAPPDVRCFEGVGSEQRGRDRSQIFVPT